MKCGAIYGCRGVSQRWGRKPAGFFLAVFGSEQLRVGHCLPSRSLHLASSLGEALRFKSGPLVRRVHHTQIYAGVIFLGTLRLKTNSELCMHALRKVLRHKKIPVRGFYAWNM